MLVHFDSKIQLRAKLQQAGHPRYLSASLWFTLAFSLVLIWLFVHHILRPDWISGLPNFVTELLSLSETATLITLSILALIYYFRHNALRLHTTPTVEEIYTLSPEDFEKYVAALFRKKGYQVIIRGRKGDHGVDLELVQAGGRTAIVQCKRYRHTVGPDIVRELFGTMIHERVHHAFLVTTAEISDAAREWAASKPMTLIDGPALVKIASSLNGQMPS